MLAIAAVVFTSLLLTGCPDGAEETTRTGPNDLQGKLLILQAYGSSADAAGASHSFVELYNTANEAINLGGIYLYFAAGYRMNEEGFNGDNDKPWERVTLTGIIPARGSFLVLGPRQNMRAAGTEGASRYQIPDNYGDINSPHFTLSNRSFKAALVRADVNLPKNPFDTDGNGTKVSGYIDMVGAANDLTHATNPDHIFGFETAPTRNSASEAVRRRDLNDTDNNAVDFIAARYASGGMNDEELEARKPRNSSAGGWAPFRPAPPVSSLVILQANTHGNADGGFAKSLVELYNNTNNAINLGTGNYYLHIGDETTPGWTNAIKLAGTIPAKSSFLIVSNNTAGTNTPRAVLPTADQQANFVLSNNGFKVVLMRNQAVLSVVNPFAEESLFSDYIDMLGVAGANAYENSAPAQSRPQITRRVSLPDTNINGVDFARTDIRRTAMADSGLYKFWPRNSIMGAWDPITGLPQVNPAVP